MATLDDQMHNAKEMADNVGKATGELVDDSRMKLQELKLSSELKDAYERLGSVTYDGIKAGTQNQALVDLVVGEIDTIQKSLEELRAAKTAPETGEKYGWGRVLDYIGVGWEDAPGVQMSFADFPEVMP